MEVAKLNTKTSRKKILFFTNLVNFLDTLAENFNTEDFECLLVNPNREWLEMSLLQRWIIITQFSVDVERLYLTGLSLGGNGTWHLGYHHTERFAAM